MRIYLFNRRCFSCCIFYCLVVSIDWLFTRRSGLEAPMHPQVLLRDLAHMNFDGVHDKCRVLDFIGRGKIIQRRLQGEAIALVIGKALRQYWDKRGAADLGDARTGGDAGGGHAEEWHEGAVLAGIVLIGGIQYSIVALEDL